MNTSNVVVDGKSEVTDEANRINQKSTTIYHYNISGKVYVFSLFVCVYHFKIKRTHNIYFYSIIFNDYNIEQFTQT